MIAAIKLAKYHDWRFEDDQDIPKRDGVFMKIMLKHLEPLCDYETWRKSKIDALKAELKALEKS